MTYGTAKKFIPVVPKTLQLPFVIDFELVDEMLFQNFWKYSVVGKVLASTKKQESDANREYRHTVFFDRLKNNTFRVIKLSSSKGAEILENANLPLLPDTLIEDIKNRLKEGQDLYKFNNHWVWIEFQPDINGNIVNYEIFTGDEPESSLQFETQKPTDLALRFRNSNAKNQFQDEFDLSIISSFHTNGFSKTVNWFSGLSTKKCELYVFLQQTVKELCEELDMKSFPKDLTAQEFMADHLNDISSIKIVADYIVERARQGNIEITGFASFLPDMSNDPGDENAAQARRALFNAAKLAFYLQKTTSHKVTLIEFVSGSRMKSLFPGNWKDKRPSGKPFDFDIATNCILRKTAQTHLIENISLLLKSVSNYKYSAYRNDNSVNEITWSVEAEPGPSFTINSLEAARNFCKLLDAKQLADAKYLKNVGLNLDLSHWSISHYSNALHGSLAEELLQEQNVCVFRRIVHAHISGSHIAGHLGDIAIQEPNPLTRKSYLINSLPGQLKELLQLLVIRKSEQTKLQNDAGAIIIPQYGRVFSQDGVIRANISIELEAIRKKEQIKASEINLLAHNIY